jgi:hypothetical protein
LIRRPFVFRVKHFLADLHHKIQTDVRWDNEYIRCYPTDGLDHIVSLLALIRVIPTEHIADLGFVGINIFSSS